MAGSEPRRRYLHQHDLCSIIASLSERDAYAAPRVSDDPSDAMARLESRYANMGTPIDDDDDRDVCDALDRAWFAQAWRETRVDFARYNAVFTLSKRAEVRESVVKDTLEKRARRGDIVKGPTQARAWDQDIRKIYLAFGMGMATTEIKSVLNELHQIGGVLKRGRAPAGGLEREVTACLAVFSGA